jgi:hypothetical protein
MLKKRVSNSDFLIKLVIAQLKRTDRFEARFEAAPVAAED